MTDFRYDGSDRRKYKRLKKQLSLRLQVKGGGDFAEWDIVLIRDIARLGVSFVYEKKLKEGLQLNLRINFGLNGAPIKCGGKVVRCLTIGNTKTFDIGVEFMNIAEADSETIDRAAVEWHAKQA